MNTHQHVFISGSSSGFGFLTAKTLLQSGHTVFASMRSLEGKNADKAGVLRNIAGETKGRLHLLDLDVTDESSVNAAVDQVVSTGSPIDVLVNNAGIGVGGFLESVTDDQFRKQFDVNVFGLQRLTRAVLPTMRAAGRGLIINISSVMGRVIIPFAGAYTASKWALEGLSESYRYELSGTGVEVVIIEPGGFGTNFFSNMEEGADRSRLESYGDFAQLPNQFWSGVGEQLTGDEAPDPQAVADAIQNLIEMPAGRRPFRTVVDPMMGGDAPRTLNRTSDEIQTKMFEGMGLQNLLSIQGHA